MALIKPFVRLRADVLTKFLEHRLPLQLSTRSLVKSLLPSYKLKAYGMLV